jgi:hypothetical protein
MEYIVYTAGRPYSYLGRKREEEEEGRKEGKKLVT